MSKKRELELAAHTHLSKMIQEFLKRYSRPRQRYERLERGLEEVDAARLTLLSELRGEWPNRKEEDE